MEDKQKICDLLAETMRQTRELNDLNALTYDAMGEKVVAKFDHRWTVINVAADSGIAMIRDILKAIGGMA